MTDAFQANREVPRASALGIFTTSAKPAEAYPPSLKLQIFLERLKTLKGSAPRGQENPP